VPLKAFVKAMADRRHDPLTQRVGIMRMMYLSHDDRNMMALLQLAGPRTMDAIKDHKDVQVVVEAGLGLLANMALAARDHYCKVRAVEVGAACGYNVKSHPHRARLWLRALRLAS
jgi:hypothetical protein